MELKKLPKEVSSLLRTGVTITTPSQCIIELVTNSIDADATSIAVRVDFRTYKIQVIDNGSGISKKNLQVLGKRYMTSKCHNLNELQGQLDKFGYRGEAIASLREVSSLLTIASRAKGSQETFSKVFAHGKSTSVGLTSEQRPCHGTTVTALDFLYNMPVRRKRIKETLDFEEMKLQLESLALMHPNVSISLRNDANKKLLLQTRKCASTVDVFRNFYGSSLANSLCPLSHIENNMEIIGCIGKEVHAHKTLQFIYINNRLVVKTKLHKLVNMILAKSFLLRSNGPWAHLPIPNDMNEKFGMPMTKKSKHGIFVINIRCPYTEYDITLDPKKTQVQFKNWPDVLQCLENAVKKFLESENLTVPAKSPSNSTKDEESSNPSIEEEEEAEDECEKEGGATKRKHFPTPQLHIARAVHGLPAKRHKSNIKSIWPPAELDTDTTVSDTTETTSDKESAKEVTLSSDESGTEIEDPIPKTLKKMELKNLSKEAVKSKCKKGKIRGKKQKPSTSQTGQKLLPDCFNQLQIYSLASNTLKKSFAHKTTSYLNRAEKSDPKFPIFNKIARDYLKTKSLSDQACQTSDTPFIEESSASNHVEFEIECLPDSASEMPNVTEMQHVDVDAVQIDDPGPTSSHQTTECNENIQQQQQHTDPPPFEMQVTSSNQNPKDQGNNLFTQMLQKIQLTQTSTSNVPANSSHRVPEYEHSTISYECAQCDKLNVSQHHQSYTPLNSNCNRDQQLKSPIQYEPVQPNARKKSRKKLSCSEIYLSSESSSSSESSDDCLSERSFKKLEAKLYGPLEDISKEINDARHTLLSDSPIVSPTKLPRSVMESPFFTGNKSPLPKFQKLLQFCYKRKPCYTPSFQTTKSKTVKYQEKISGDSPFSKLDRHVAELENLTKLDVETGVGLYSEVSQFVQTRAQMLEQSHSIIIGNQDQNSATTQSKNCPTQEVPQHPNHLPLVTTTSFLSTAEMLQSINQPIISAIEDDSMLSCSAMLENISGDVTEPTAHSCQSKMYADLSRSQSGQQDILPSNLQLPESSCSQTGSDLFMEVDRSPILQYSIKSTTQLQTQPVLVNTTDPSVNDSPYHRRSHLVPYSSSSSSDETEIKPGNASWNFILNSDDMESVESDQANCLQQLFSSNSNNASQQHYYEEPISSNSDGNALSVFRNSTDVENDTQNFPLGGSSLIPPSIQIDELTMESRNHQSGMTEINKEENSTIPLEIEHTETIEPPLTVSLDGIDEDQWQERVDPSGKKYYFNGKTSITTYVDPATPQCSFSMTPRHAFMPKGTSPVLAIPSCSSGPQAESLSAEEQAKLQQALEESNSLEHHLANVKWTRLTDGKPSEIIQLVQKSLSDIESSVRYEGAIRNALENNDTIVKTCQILHDFKFSKDMFENFKVLGQWDSKFILTVMNLQNEQEPHLLVLFDQHAVHERVRLERLMAEYQSDPETHEFRSEEICPTLLLRLSEKEVCVILSYQEKFQRLGLKFKVFNNRKVLVSHVPTCLKLRCERQRSSQRQCLEEMVTSLVSEQVHSLLQTRGVGVTVPPTLQSILNSEACTGAVKFGDPLSTSECHMLLSCLGKCSVPFQCAHGRPVLAPLADLQHVDQHKVKKPALAGLLQRLKPQLDK